MGHRCGSDPMLLWLWHRLVALALIRPLAWESPHAAEAVQEIAKKKKKNHNNGIKVATKINEKEFRVQKQTHAFMIN